MTVSNTFKVKFMNGPLATATKTINMDDTMIVPGDVITVEGRKGQFHKYWIKQETLVDGSFKGCYLDDRGAK